MLAVSSVCVAAIVASIFLGDVPDFTDPQAGFETRGTPISARLSAWSNLVDSISHAGPLTANPLEGGRLLNLKAVRAKGRKRRPKNGAKKQNQKRGRNRGRKRNNNREESSATRSVRSATDEDGDVDPPAPAAGPAVASPLMTSMEHRDIGWMCGEPMADYAHVVFEAVDHDEEGESEDLFTHSAILSMCTLESVYLRSAPQFRDLCETKGPVDCCPGWNLGGYVALINNRSSCFGITPDDVAVTRRLLLDCSRYFRGGELYPDCQFDPVRPCRHIPTRCTRYNAVYTILHFLADDNFVLPGDSLNSTRLRWSVSFLPLARSSATLDYYFAITEESRTDGAIADGVTKVVAMDLGLKNTLFDLYLFSDAVCLVVAAVLILACILAFTQSFFLSLATTVSIAFSLGLAYAIYTLVLQIKFFPFMNILASVIAVGVGADDTFILVKSWSLHGGAKDKDAPTAAAATTKEAAAEETPFDACLERRMTSTLRHSCMSMLVTSLTTAIAFFASYISSITAIKCFSVFAGLAILCNFAMMVTWIPASLAFHERYCHASCCCCLVRPPPPPQNGASDEAATAESSADSIALSTSAKSASAATVSVLEACGAGRVLCSLLSAANRSTAKFFDQTLPVHLIWKLRYLWILLLGGIIICSTAAVFYYPGLRLPDSEEFQLFSSDHSFERYDLRFKELFGFERAVKRDISMRMPLRFVWGVEAIDNGDFLDPGDKGRMVADERFDLSSSEAQRWMLSFCKELRRQSFYSPSPGPMLSNCFMETFSEWMERPCKAGLTGEDRAPCCQASRFPYTRSIFEKCLLLAVHDLYETPTDLWIPGVAGPKFNATTGRVAAAVIEYDAKQIFSFSHPEMQSFEKVVDNWFSRVIKTAPPELSGGFFVSHLGFYDVQDSLARDTLLAVAVAMSVAVVVLLASTLDVVLSVAAVVCVSGIIFVSVAALILLGWRLNILESVAITLAIGLSVDFTLHYAVKFRQAKGDNMGRVAYAASHTAGPVAMAAITTLLAGACLLPTRVLAYIQIGTFIVIVISVSWFFSTFFLLSVLSVAGSGPVIASCPDKKDCLKKMKKYDDEDDQNTAEEKSVVVASISFDDCIERYSPKRVSPDTMQQQSPYAGVPLVSRNPSASVCDIIRQTPETDKGSPSNLGSRTPRDRRPFTESSEERILQDEKHSVQNGTAIVKAHKRKQKQNQQLQQLQQQHLIQQQQLLQHQQRQVQEQQQRQQEKSQPQQQQGRFVFDRPDDKTAIAPPSVDARMTRTVMMTPSSQPATSSRRRSAATARVTPECCAMAAAVDATAGNSSTVLATAAGNSWQLATAGHSSTVDSRRRAPPAQRRRKNRSAENLLAQCDCQFFEDQARQQQRLLQETAVVHCDAPTIRADVEMSGAAKARQRAMRRQQSKAKSSKSLESPANSKFREREAAAAAVAEHVPVPVPVPAPRRLNKDGDREGRSSAGDIPDHHHLQYFTTEFDSGGGGRKASITTVIDAEELKRKKEKAATVTPKRLSLIDVKEEAEAVAAAVRMRRRSSRQKSFQAAMIKHDNTHEDDNVFESSSPSDAAAAAAERVSSPKVTPSRVKLQEQHQEQEQHHQTLQQDEELQRPDLLPHPHQQYHACDQEEQQQQQQEEDPERDEEPSHSRQSQEQQQPKSNEESREGEHIHRERSRSLYKREDSYRAAQETNPIADPDEFWYVDKDPNRERTRSSGNLFDDERYYERQMAKSVRPRNSASMGNILDVRQSSLEYAPLPPPREPKSKASPPPPPLPLKPQSIYANVSSSSTKCKLRSSYHYERHPLSHSTTAILTEDDDDQTPPIVPNKSPATPDVWVARTIKA